VSPDILKERHYSVAELSKIWGISYEALRTKLLKTPGVLKFEQPRGKSKRPYITIRVPESVAVMLYK
jgi:hypothetical protein